MPTKYLVTSALPYANGKLHIGHVAGAYLPADIFVRYLKLRGEDVIYVCGSDEHGAPISIKAESEGVTSREIVDRYHASIKASFDGLGVEFDNFSGTARPKHVALSQHFFTNLLEAGYITTHTNQQLYCENDRRFLADRYVEGVCPFCGASGARGDQCDACGKLIDAVKLVEPKCKICGHQPVIRETTHWFLDLPKFEPQLREWLKTKESYWKDNVFRFIWSWLDEGLIERAITRDIDWGAPVPLPEATGKVLYVWFDAPIGYISSTVEWAERIGQPDRWKDYWLDPETKLVHFIGKDNIPFHTIIWPAILMGQSEKYVMPHDVPANEFLNLEGQKISTSRNWAIWADEFLETFDGELLRYVLAANAPENKDCDFSWKDFQSRVNGELANVLGNLANRVLTFANKQFQGEITAHESGRSIDEYELLGEIRRITSDISESYSRYQVRKAVGLCMDIARLGNKWFDDRQPWAKIKTERAHAEETIWVSCELLRVLSVVLAPVLPKSMGKLRAQLGLADAPQWRDEPTALIDHGVTRYVLGETTPLFPRIEDDIIDTLLKKLMDNVSGAPKADDAPPPIEHKPEIEYDDFARMELRLATVLEAVAAPKSEKLLRLKVRIGSETREVTAGIAKHYSPEALVGKTVAMLVNLKPRKLMGAISQGMILAAEHDGELSVLVPDKGFPDGCGIA
jgi:methionyl-tRNA synthetase